MLMDFRSQVGMLMDFIFIVFQVFQSVEKEMEQ
jgi:hypothetical protein